MYELLLNRQSLLITYSFFMQWDNCIVMKMFQHYRCAILDLHRHSYNQFRKKSYRLSVIFLKKTGYTVEFGHLPNIESDCTINQISVFSLAVGHKVQRFDGYYNNLAYPTWGSAGMSLFYFKTLNYCIYLKAKKKLSIEP